jgi:hypothetical protein
MIASGMTANALSIGKTGKGTTSVVPPMASRGAALAAEGDPRVRFVR